MQLHLQLRRLSFDSLLIECFSDWFCNESSLVCSCSSLSSCALSLKLLIILMGSGRCYIIFTSMKWYIWTECSNTRSFCVHL